MFLVLNIFKYGVDSHHQTFNCCNLVLEVDNDAVVFIHVPHNYLSRALSAGGVGL
jgi:hypothetical protein